MVQSGWAAGLIALSGKDRPKRVSWLSLTSGRAASWRATDPIQVVEIAESMMKRRLAPMGTITMRHPAAKNARRAGGRSSALTSIANQIIP